MHYHWKFSYHIQPIYKSTPSQIQRTQTLKPTPCKIYTSKEPNKNTPITSLYPPKKDYPSTTQTGGLLNKGAQTFIDKKKTTNIEGDPQRAGGSSWSEGVYPEQVNLITRLTQKPPKRDRCHIWPGYGAPRMQPNDPASRGSTGTRRT